MKKFRTKTYQFETTKLTGGQNVRFAVLADLHGLSFGEENQELYRAIEEAEVDAVLVAGDMVVSSDIGTARAVTGFFSGLAEKFPVFYALGNHEYKMLQNPDTADAYLDFERTLTQAGVCFLHNEHVSMEIKGTDFIFYGLELPVQYYKKPKSPRLKHREVRELLGNSYQNGISVLLAHNPKYGKTYFRWGADFIFCGHYHGGILRLSEHHGLSCPQYLLFPPYCCGDFHHGNQHMLVSAGLGEHTIPIRIHNPRELLIAEIVFTQNHPTGEYTKDGNTR